MKRQRTRASDVPVAPSESPWDTPLDVAANPNVSQHEPPGATLALAEDRSPMFLFVAAIGATVTAILELTVGPYLRVGDAQPHLVFIFAIICTVAVSLESGLVWAFVGGIALDALAQRPLGASSFALIITVGFAAVLARLFIRLRPLVVAPAVAVFSVVYSMTLFLLLGALGSSLASHDPISAIAPGAAYDAVVGVIVGPLAVALHDRYVDEPRVDW